MVQNIFTEKYHGHQGEAVHYIDDEAVSQDPINVINIFFSVSGGNEGRDRVGYTYSKKHQDIKYHVGQPCCCQLPGSNMSDHDIVGYTHHYVSQLAEHDRVGQEETGANVGAVGGEEFQWRVRDSGRGLLDAGF